MNRPTYRVVIKGIAPGREPEGAAPELAALLKTTPQRLVGLLKSGSVVFKKHTDHATARRMKSALERRGASVSIVQETEGDSASKEPHMACPKCGFEQPLSAECVRCGIIVDKYRNRQNRPAHRPSRAGLARPEPRTPALPQRSLKKTLALKVGIPAAAAVAALLIGLFLELFYLRGDPVTQGSVGIHDKKDFLAISVDRPQTEYLVQISTRRLHSLTIRLEGPAGAVIYRDTEYARHKGTRIFTFKPKKAGWYHLYVDPGALATNGEGHAKTGVFVNDRRVLVRVLAWFKL
jgi:hypothetical protein